MKIETQVCTLEQAKKLKDLGVEQTSLVIYMTCSNGEIQLRHYNDFNKVSVAKDDGLFSAFTVAELGVMLPVDKYGDDVFSHKLSNMYATESWFRCSYKDLNHWDDKPTEAEARAAMLIYLIGNRLVNIEDVNKRLQNA